MKRRISLAAGLAGVATMAVGAAVATAAPATPAATKAKKVVLNCAVTLTVAAPADSAQVVLPPTGGWQYGHALCPKVGFGRGAMASPFRVPITGDTIGSYTQYFAAGEIKGKYDLSPQDTPDPSNFTAEAWTGTVTVTGGTGIYKGIKSLRSAPGKLVCSSADTVHITCTERIKLKLPPSA